MVPLADTTNKSDALHIRADGDADRPVVLHPHDNDVFVRTGRQVIESCRLKISFDVWRDELNALCQAMQDWADKNSTKVRTVYLAMVDVRPTLFVAPHGQQFDFFLADELVRLGVEFPRRFNVGPIELFQVPWDEMGRFLDPDAAFHIYGHKVPSNSVEA